MDLFQWISTKVITAYFTAVKGSIFTFCLLSPHFCFSRGFICDLFAVRNDSRMS